MKPILYLISSGVLINLNLVETITKRDFAEADPRTGLRGNTGRFVIVFSNNAGEDPLYEYDAYETSTLRDAAWYELVKRFGCGI